MKTLIFEDSTEKNLQVIAHILADNGIILQANAGIRLGNTTILRAIQYILPDTLNILLVRHVSQVDNAHIQLDMINIPEDTVYVHGDNADNLQDALNITLAMDAIRQDIPVIQLDDPAVHAMSNEK